MIRQFADELVEAFIREELPGGLSGETDFERRFAIPVAGKVAKRFRSVELFIHPVPNTHCDPTCDDAAARLLGCAECWTATKKWACVSAFGTRHTFDMVAKEDTIALAVEVKLVEARGGRMPNGNIQRFLGQCALAAAKHPHVIGLCGFRGAPVQERHADTGAMTKWFYERGVRLVFRNIE